MSGGFYYVQHKVYVGNSLLWWREGGSGYTCDLNQAWRLTKEGAERVCRHRPDIDVAWPAEDIDAIAQRHVDVQDLHRIRR